MTDIIIINRLQFEEKRSDVDKDSAIYKKYGSLFLKYQCFSNTYINLFTPPKGNGEFSYKNTNNNHNHSSGGRYNNNYNKKPHHFIEDRNPFLSKKPKELSKIILGILNVLNNENYNKMIAKIRLLKSDVNIEDIIVEILDKCCLQVFYLNIYMRLVQDIINLCTEAEKKIALASINKYVDNYIDNSEWKNEYIKSENEEDYNAFCGSQKLKSTLIAKNMMANRLMTMFELNRTVNDYALLIINDLKVHLEIKNENVCIILIQMLIYMSKTVKDIIKKLFDIDNVYIYTRVTGSKIKFIIDEFLAIIN